MMKKSKLQVARQLFSSFQNKIQQERDEKLATADNSKVEDVV
jgi:hypothetical protein